MISFTIHFATINTEVRALFSSYYTKFTIHFATINTNKPFLSTSTIYSFTIHFATINTLGVQDDGSEIVDLQYTLLLLIQ